MAEQKYQENKPAHPDKRVSTVPGVRARHAVVTDQCRENRTDEGAVDEALRRLREEALAAMQNWEQGSGAQFHFMLTVERPETPIKEK